MTNISRRCVPFTPFEKELSTATVTLVSNTGIHLLDQEPFPIEDPGDITHRVIPGDANVGELKISHHHYDHSEADGDPNIVFPLETLRELAAEGFIKAVNDKHYTWGFTTRLKELYETTLPEIADQIDRSKTKLVLLTAGCPGTCHRSISNAAREIEAMGIPTLIISASPAETEAVKPPRGVTFKETGIGRIIGGAGDRELHKRLIKAALETFLQDTPPGKVVQRDA